MHLKITNFRAFHDETRTLCWERSSCIDTDMPVGMWVTLTALSVLLTLCPPGPDDRKVSMRISLGLICTSAYELRWFLKK